MESQEHNASNSIKGSILTLRVGGLMGFELLPIEDGDENRYDVFTITSPGRWTYQKSANEIPSEPAFYDPNDNSFL